MVFGLWQIWIWFKQLEAVKNLPLQAGFYKKNHSALNILLLKSN